MSKNQVVMEAIENPEKFENYKAVDTYLDQNIEWVLKKIDNMMERFGNKFPSSSSIKGRYSVIENIEWTTSFWTGLLWLAYEHTGLDKYKNLAREHVQSFSQRIQRKGADVQHHDIGFLYTLSTVADYRLTKNEESKQIAQEAGDFLTKRYLPAAKIIQAWGNLEDPKEQGRMIIDCNMNLPLLYWLSQVSSDPKYRDIAYAHVQQAEKYIVRNDASTFHTYYMDINTGAPKFGKTHQGATDSSCWARGQAWAIYGFVLSYKYTRDPKFISLAQKLTQYFLNRLPSDLICYWDLSFEEGSKESRDSSSNAIVICGLLEMQKYLPLSDPNREFYKNVIFSMMNSLNNSYISKDLSKDGILEHAAYAVPQGIGVDEFCIWGDYFYFEALTRMKKYWDPYW